jgi:hypothetical protein
LRRTRADNSPVPDNSWPSRTTPLACLVGVAVCLWMGFSVPERGTDFNEFYSAGKLVGSGQLYNWDRMQEIERLHPTNQTPFGRFPFYAILFKPLAWLPYAWGRAAWFALNALALLLFAVLWPVESRDRLAMSLCWCCPAALLLSMGQDTGLFLCFVAIGLRLLASNRNFAAGLVLSLCAAKFHLALGIPVFLLAQRKWATLAGGALGGLLQLAISFAVEGRDWPAQLLRLSANPEFATAIPKMPNLFGLTWWLPFGAVVEAALAALVLAAVWVVSRRSSPVTGITAAVIGGLLVSHHAYVYDTVLLLPALALAWQLPVPAALRYGVMSLWTPIPYLLLMKDRMAAVGQLSISVFCLALLAVLAAGCLGLQASPRREEACGRLPVSA